MCVLGEGVRGWRRELLLYWGLSGVLNPWNFVHKNQRSSEPNRNMFTFCKYSNNTNRSGQNHLARHNERGKKTRHTEKEVGRQHQGMDTPGVRRVPKDSGEQRKTEQTGCEVICGAKTTLRLRDRWRRVKKKYNRSSNTLQVDTN